MCIDGQVVGRGAAADGVVAALPREKGLRVGRSLFYPPEPKFAPEADMYDLRIYEGAARPVWMA